MYLLRWHTEDTYSFTVTEDNLPETLMTALPSADVNMEGKPIKLEVFKIDVKGLNSFFRGSDEDKGLLDHYLELVETHEVEFIPRIASTHIEP